VAWVVANCFARGTTDIMTPLAAALDMLARTVGPAGYHSPRYMMPFNSSMRAHITRHVIGCRVTQEMRAQVRWKRVHILLKVGLAVGCN